MKLARTIGARIVWLYVVVVLALIVFLLAHGIKNLRAPTHLH